MANFNPLTHPAAESLLPGDFLNVLKTLYPTRPAPITQLMSPLIADIALPEESSSRELDEFGIPDSASKFFLLPKVCVGPLLAHHHIMYTKWFIPIASVSQIRSVVPQPPKEPESKKACSFIIRTSLKDYVLRASDSRQFFRWTFLLSRAGENYAAAKDPALPSYIRPSNIVDEVVFRLSLFRDTVNELVFKDLHSSEYLIPIVTPKSLLYGADSALGARNRGLSFPDEISVDIYSQTVITNQNMSPTISSNRMSPTTMQNSQSSADSLSSVGNSSKVQPSLERVNSAARIPPHYTGASGSISSDLYAGSNASMKPQSSEESYRPMEMQPQTSVEPYVNRNMGASPIALKSRTSPQGRNRADPNGSKTGTSLQGHGRTNPPDLYNNVNASALPPGPHRSVEAPLDKNSVPGPTTPSPDVLDIEPPTVVLQGRMSVSGSESDDLSLSGESEGISDGEAGSEKRPGGIPNSAVDEAGYYEIKAIEKTEPSNMQRHLSSASYYGESSRRSVELGFSKNKQRLSVISSGGISVDSHALHENVPASRDITVGDSGHGHHENHRFRKLEVKFPSFVHFCESVKRLVCRLRGLALIDEGSSTFLASNSPSMFCQTDKPAYPVYYKYAVVNIPYFTQLVSEYCHKFAREMKLAGVSSAGAANNMEEAFGKFERMVRDFELVRNTWNDRVAQSIQRKQEVTDQISMEVGEIGQALLAVGEAIVTFLEKIFNS